MDFRRFSHRPKQQPQEQSAQKSAERNIADYRERILRFIRMHGPSVPNEVRREIGKDTIITSAMLSELASNKRVRLSYLKVGGSPLYYIGGQEEQLLRFVDRLHKREREALEHLKKELVVRDEDLAPVQRVAMRELKDFAVPLTVTLRDHKEMFWKWYLVKNEEISEKIKQLMPKPEVKPEPAPEAKPETPQPETKLEQKPEQVAAPETKPEPKPEPQQPQAEPKAKAPEKKVAEKPKKAGKEVNDRFYQRVREYCEERGITILNVEVIRKNSELDLTLQVPSAVGSLTYYAKAKSKKIANDTDLAAAMVEAQSLRLPALFLTPGKLTKKAQQKLNKELKGLIIKNI